MSKSSLPAPRVGVRGRCPRAAAEQLGQHRVSTGPAQRTSLWDRGPSTREVPAGDRAQFDCPSGGKGDPRPERVWRRRGRVPRCRAVGDAPLHHQQPDGLTRCFGMRVWSGDSGINCLFLFNTTLLLRARGSPRERFPDAVAELQRRRGPSRANQPFDGFLRFLQWGCDGKRNFIDWSSAAPVSHHLP